MPANTTADRSTGKVPSRLLGLVIALPLVVFVTGASVTAIIWQRLEASNKVTTATHIDAHFEELLASLDQQLKNHTLTLRGIAGLFAGSEQVSREEFRDYVAAIQLPKYLPGVRSVGYAAAVPHPELLYIEPRTSDTERTLELKLLTSPVRGVALETASRSAVTSMTAPVQLLTEGEGGSTLGLELYLADYCENGESGMALSPGSEVCGWVIMGMDINSIIGSALGADLAHFDPELAIAITDNDAPAAARAVYLSAQFADNQDPAHQRQAELPLAGRTWTVTAHPLPNSVLSYRDRTATWALAAGSAITLLTTVFFLLLARSYRRLLALIDTSLRTQRQLERSQEQLEISENSHREMFTANPLPMWVYDLETLRFLAVNAAAIDKYGYSREEFLALTIADIRPVEERARLHQYLEVHPDTIDHAGCWQHTAKDGRVIDVEIHAHPVTFNSRAAELVMAQDVTQRLQAERDLLAHNVQLERMNQAMVDRELKMVALKAEVNSLSKSLGRPEPYPRAQLPDQRGDVDA